MMRARFALDRDIKHIGAGGGERRAERSGEADQRDAEARHGREQPEDLFGFAGVAESDKDISGCENAEVAVESFSGMQEVGRGSGGAEGGCDLAGDEAGFADSGDDGAMACTDGPGEELGDVVEGPAHRAIEALSEQFERGGFNADELGGVGNVVRHGTEKMVAVRKGMEDSERQER